MLKHTGRALWWAVRRSDDALPVIFETKRDALANAEPGEASLPRHDHQHAPAAVRDERAGAAAAQPAREEGRPTGAGLVNGANCNIITPSVMETKTGKGPRSLFRPKQPPNRSHSLTGHSKDVLAAFVSRTGSSESDVVDWLVRTQTWGPGGTAEVFFRDAAAVPEP